MRSSKWKVEERIVNYAKEKKKKKLTCDAERTLSELNYLIFANWENALERRITK